MIDLYYYTSPNVRKVLIALEEFGLPYEIKWTDISAGEQFDPDYLAVNPNGKVPAIVDHDGPGGRPLPVFESGAILLYLAEKTGQLLPADPQRRWEAICWLFWQVANHGPMAGQAAHFVSHAPKHGINDAYATGRYIGEVRRLYEVMNTRLAIADYLAGEFSVADIACFPWARVSSGHGVDVTAEFPQVAAWMERIGQRPSAKVRIDDPREEKARKSEYTDEQFQTLFRPMAEAVNPATGGRVYPSVEGQSA
jgi:GSH-dependent disulfide-bond oxidoreductase